jgi:dihydropteroate synthase
VVQPLHSTPLLANGKTLTRPDRPLVMGVVNVTPDSFSDGGRFLSLQGALDHALRLIDDGAELLDLGGESTRPGGGVYGSGAAEVSIAEELERLLPVLRGLRGRTVVPLSIDTRKAEVAQAALADGADLINDVSGLADPAMAGVIAACGCPVVIMHSRGSLSSMQAEIHFHDVVSEVRDELLARAEHARAAGVASSQIILDPGIGFGKTVQHNLRLLAELESLRETGHAVLVGASRKSFIGALSGAPVERRLPGSLAAVAVAAMAEVDVVRVHDVAETRQFLEVLTAIRGAA